MKYNVLCLGVLGLFAADVLGRGYPAGISQSSHNGHTTHAAQAHPYSGIEPYVPSVHGQHTTSIHDTASLQAEVAHYQAEAERFKKQAAHYEAMAKHYQQQADRPNHGAGGQNAEAMHYKKQAEHWYHEYHQLEEETFWEADGLISLMSMKSIKAQLKYMKVKDMERLLPAFERLLELYKAAAEHPHATERERNLFQNGHIQRLEYIITYMKKQLGHTSGHKTAHITGGNESNGTSSRQVSASSNGHLGRNHEGVAAHHNMRPL